MCTPFTLPNPFVLPTTYGRFGSLTGWALTLWYNPLFAAPALIVIVAAAAGIGGGYPTRGMVEMAVRELGAERVICGSDVTGRSFASQLGKVHGARISEREKAIILSEDFHRLMRPILEARGIQVEKSRGCPCSADAGWCGAPLLGTSSAVLGSRENSREGT